MTFIVRHSGAQTTIQDLGRIGWQHAGVPVGGALDQQAHRVANLLVGNVASDAALESVFGGLTLQFRRETIIALAGRDVSASLDGAPVLPWRPALAPANSVLALHAGVRTTIALGGGIVVPSVLGSRSTALRGGFGGVDGRAVMREDTLPLGRHTPLHTAIAEALANETQRSATWGAGPSVRPPYSNELTVRCIAGPHFDVLTETSRDAFRRDAFELAADSDRMGFRFRGPTLALMTTQDVVSSGVTHGTVQLPPDGSPIVLMADRQTTGGYPRIADVITVDLPLLAQLRPGEKVRFALVPLDVAHTAYHARERDLARAALALRLRFPTDAA
jgi:antagonist of KipI